MRTLSSLLFCVLLLCPQAIAQGKKSKVPARHFYFEIRHQHGMPEWFQIYQRGSGWICRTESNPFFKAKGNPLEGLNWAAIKKARAADSPGCQTQVILRDLRATPSKSLEKCGEDPLLQKMMGQLNRACRVV